MQAKVILMGICALQISQFKFNGLNGLLFQCFAIFHFRFELITIKRTNGFTLKHPAWLSLYYFNVINCAFSVYLQTSGNVAFYLLTNSTLWVLRAHAH